LALDLSSPRRRSREAFVPAELHKLAGWSGRRLELAHFRDKERNEAAVVIEDRRGRVVGVEVKAAATVTGADFAGLRRLAEACGDRLALGLVLYDHDKVVPFGERFFAAPADARALIGMGGVLFSRAAGTPSRREVL
jgi:uncharacterized protein